MISLDYTFMTEGAVRGGIADASLSAAARAFEGAHAAVMNRWKSGELGFFDLPDDAQIVKDCQELTAAARLKSVDDVVVLGIGGSGLGPVALRTALLPPGWNALSRAERHRRPRLHVLDNVDPRTIDALLDRVEFATTLFIVTSKSGGTAETLAQYLVIRGRLDAAGRLAREHLVFVTDPEKGALRRIAREENIPALAIPPNVGGRFSVLSPVGVLPAALTGIDVPALLAGAADMRERCNSSTWSSNPAGAFAVLQWLADSQLGRHSHVFMPYADGLRDMAGWFVQLWAESLGKSRPDGSPVGPTPIAALGATDQHSQVQLFMEGPNDKTVTFVTLAGEEADLEIPHLHREHADLSYLGGHRLGELLSVEQRATAGALAARGRMSMTFTVEKLDAWHLGGLFMLLEIATAYAGELYGVNAFDQPGVELGKRFTYGMFGRPGFESDLAAFEALPKQDPRRVL
ncbi:MAG TPA: glucose-6-phosphate isomerase [Gemmatimonadaceae bacterium]|nr:glucose-6-phosphate isomerase [Gemmatimonadaceae bacterium]